MTILFLSHEDDKLMGSTLSLVNMVHSLQRVGHRCIVALPGDGVARDHLEAQGIPTITAHYHVDFVGRGSRLRQVCSFPYRLIRDWHDHRKAIRSLAIQLQDEHIDIVHTNTAVLDFGPALARQLNVPHVWHLREFIDQDMGFRPFLGWRRLRSLISQADATISITQAIAQHYGVLPMVDDGALTKGHLHAVMFDAVRSAHSLIQCSELKPQFVFCGQLAPHKGPDVAIRAFCRLAPAHPDYQLLLMGTAVDASYEARLHAMVPAELNDRIRFLGYVEHPDQIIACSTALLMCSRSEAQGRVTVEAMLQHCPVIGFNAGGTCEIISHGQTGLLFDDEDQLLAAMQQLINDQSLADDLRSQAFDFACNHFLEESYGARLTQIYQQLCPQYP